MIYRIFFLLLLGLCLGEVRAQRDMATYNRNVEAARRDIDQPQDTGPSIYTYVLESYIQSQLRAQERRRQEALARKKEAREILAYHNQGLEQVKQKKYDEALETYNEAIGKFPRVSMLYLNRGQVKFIVENLEGALEDFIKATEVDPKATKAHIYAASLAGSLYGLDRRIKILDRAIELNRSSAVFYYLRGKALQSQKKYILAINNYDRAIQLDDKYAFAFYQRGLAYYHLSKYDYAMINANQSIRYHPEKNAEAYNLKALVLEAQEKPEEAFTWYSKAIQEQPKNPNFLVNRSWLHYRAKRYSEAFKDLDQAIALAPKIGTLYYQRGVWMARLGGKKEAYCSFVNRGCELGHQEACSFLKQISCE